MTVHPHTEGGDSSMTDRPEATQPQNTGRRSFLKLAATAAPVVAATTVAGTAEAGPAEPDLTEVRVQDTAHTRAYYASARF